jgi:sugar porter (SP) family MFS transporter
MEGSGSAWPAIVVGVFVAFGGILFGYDTGTIGGILAMKYWVKEFAKDKDADGNTVLGSGDKSLIVSILSVGTFFGALMAAPSADLLGRRMGLVFSCLVFTLGVILQTAATAIPLFVVGRLIAGWGVGLLSAQVPMYQSETSPKWIRGTIVGCYQLAITIGLLIAAVADYGTQNRNDTGSYRIPIAIQFAWAIILVVGMLILPETPRYLIKKDKFEAAQKSLSRLRRLPPDHPEILAELQEIAANYEYEISLGKSSYKDLFTNRDGWLLKRLLTGCGLQALQQLTGVNFIFYYGTTFFKSAGIGKPFTITMITNCVNVASTFPGLYMVESWGRRNLLLFGAAGMCICQFIVAIVGVTAHSQEAQKALISFVCIYIFFFACSWGPVAWVVTGEIFPLKSRAKGLSITTATNWLLNWAIGYATPYMVDNEPGDANLGSKVFFIWGSFCGLCFIFVWMCIYETKGFTLEQVDELYEKVPHAWNSPGFVPTVSFKDINEERKSVVGDIATGRRMTLSEIEASVQRRKSEAGVDGHGASEKAAEA